MSNINRKISAGRATRARILETARELFASGYDAVGTPEIAKRADVTRGALYHHFADKRALFDAVVCAVAETIVAEIDAVAARYQHDPLAAFCAGSLAFIDSCQSQSVRQIFLVDGPSVLGWTRWREIDATHGLGSLRSGLAGVLASEPLHPHRAEVIAHLLSGALNEAAFYIADHCVDAQRVEQMKEETVAMLQATLRRS